MTNTLLLVLIGAFVGWNLPQPVWAKWIQAKGISIFSKIKAKFGPKPAKEPVKEDKKEPEEFRGD